MNHDYTSPRWGHAVSVFDSKDRGKTALCGGHGLGLKVGDGILLRGAGETVRYRVLKVRYETNVRDMWWADVEFVEVVG